MLKNLIKSIKYLYFIKRFKLSESVLTFDEALYFITVTCSTVGYGDYAP